MQVFVFQRSIGNPGTLGIGGVLYGSGRVFKSDRLVAELKTLPSRFGGQPDEAPRRESGIIPISREEWVLW